VPAKGIGYMPVRIVCRLESIRFRFYRRENPLGILADIFVSLAGDDEDFAGLFSWLRIQISYICNGKLRKECNLLEMSVG